MAKAIPWKKAKGGALGGAGSQVKGSKRVGGGGKKASKKVGGGGGK
jgi:hypothetical protein